MTLTEIDELTLESDGIIPILLGRLKIKEDPEDGSLEIDLESYKKILIGEEKTRLAEVARIEDFKSRLDSIADLRMTMYDIGCTDANLELFKKSIIQENKLKLLKALEAQAGATDKAIADEETSRIARKLIKDTDYKVIRHRDQIDSGESTTLSDSEYKSLLTDRQDARDSILK